LPNQDASRDPTSEAPQNITRLASWHGLSLAPAGTVSLWLAVAGAAGGAVAIALMEELSTRAAFPLVFVPFATSIVLVMGSPEIEAAQPRALVGGHLLATLVGLLVVKIAGPGPLAAAFAVGLAMVAMHLQFSPAGGDRPPGRGGEQLVLELSVGAGAGRGVLARCHGLHLAQFLPPRLLAPAVVVMPERHALWFGPKGALSRPIVPLP